VVCERTLIVRKREAVITAKKIAISFSVVFAVVLVCLTFFLIAAEYSTDTISPLEQAKAYETEGNYEQAEAIYRSIVTDWPGTDEAFQAQKNLALLFIVTRNYPAAQAEVDALITDFAGHLDLAQTIYDIANSCWFAGNYHRARWLYKYIADNIPDSNWAIVGQTWVAGSDMKLGNYAAAQEEIDALITDFGGHPGLAAAVYETANQFWYAGRYEDAQQVYQRVLETDPNSDSAILAKAWVIGLDLALGNSTSVQQVIDKVLAECARYPDLGEMIYSIANGCWYVGKYEQARQLYKYIADNTPDSAFVMRAQAWVAGSDIRLGNYAAAQAGIDSLITDFGDHPDLPEAILEVGEEYSNQAFQMQNEGRNAEAKDYSTKALTLWERIIREFAHSPTTVDAYFISAACYHHQLAEYEKAIEYYRKIVDNWSDYERAGKAQFSIGLCYQGLKNSGGLPESAADSETKVAYEALLQKYPNCIEAIPARNWLMKHK